MSLERSEYTMLCYGSQLLFYILFKHLGLYIKESTNYQYQEQKDGVILRFYYKKQKHAINNFVSMHFQYSEKQQRKNFQKQMNQKI